MMNSKEIDTTQIDEHFKGIPPSKSEIDISVKLDTLNEVAASLISHKSRKQEYIRKRITPDAANNLLKLFQIARDSANSERQDVSGKETETIIKTEALNIHRLNLYSLNDIERYERLREAEKRTLCRTESQSSLVPERPKSRQRV